MSNGDHGLLSPGSSRAEGQFDDAALVAAMVAVEVAWLRALSTTGALAAGDVSTLAERLRTGRRTWTQSRSGRRRPGTLSSRWWRRFAPTWQAIPSPAASTVG